MAVPVVVGLTAWALFFVPTLLVWWLPGHREITAMTRRTPHPARGGSAGPVGTTTGPAPEQAVT